MSIITFFLPSNLIAIRDTMQLMGLGTGLIWFVLYFWMVKQTTGSPRNKALLTILSVIIALMGFFFDSERVLQMHVFPVILPPILYIVGSLLLGYVLFRND
jgi:formate-dependent nitrite reductase membrane component NrfD